MTYCSSYKSIYLSLHMQEILNVEFCDDDSDSQLIKVKEIRQ